MTIGSLIKQYRIQNEMTMQEFAERTGLSKGYISMLERGKHPQNNKKIVPSIATVKKIAIAMNATVDEILEAIDGKQLINISPKDSFTDSDIAKLTNISIPAARPIPIIGTICAGDGIWCEDNFEGHFFIDSSIKADMCLKVSGDSMVDAGITDGDIALIKKTYEYADGNIYAVRMDDCSEATLKKIAMQDDNIILSPCNAEYSPILKNVNDVCIIGECVGVYHSIK